MLVLAALVSTSFCLLERGGIWLDHSMLIMKGRETVSVRLHMAT
jgi:hypothetical protein